MAAPVYPSGVTVQGNIKLQWVTVIADPEAPSLATEINAASSLDISCYVGGDSWNPDIEQNKGEAPRRLCTKVQRDVFGNLKYSLADLMYSVSPQGAALSEGKKAYEALTPGTTGFIVARLGLDAVDTDWAAAQFVDIWPVTLGARLKVGDPSNEFNEFMVKQPIVVAAPGQPYEDIVIAA